MDNTVYENGTMRVTRLRPTCWNVSPIKNTGKGAPFQFRTKKAAVKFADDWSAAAAAGESAHYLDAIAVIARRGDRQ